MLSRSPPALPRAAGDRGDPRAHRWPPYRGAAGAARGSWPRRRRTMRCRSCSRRRRPGLTRGRSSSPASAPMQPSTATTATPRRSRRPTCPRAAVAKATWRRSARPCLRHAGHPRARRARAARRRTAERACRATTTVCWTPSTAVPPSAAGRHCCPPAAERLSASYGAYDDGRAEQKPGRATPGWDPTEAVRKHTREFTELNRAGIAHAERFCFKRRRHGARHAKFKKAVRDAETPEAIAAQRERLRRHTASQAARRFHSQLAKAQANVRQPLGRTAPVHEGVAATAPPTSIAGSRGTSTAAGAMAATATAAAAVTTRCRRSRGSGRVHHRCGRRHRQLLRRRRGRGQEWSGLRVAPCCARVSRPHAGRPHRRAAGRGGAEARPLPPPTRLPPRGRDEGFRASSGPREG